MERPTKPLTLGQYRAALASMINRMVKEAGPEQAAYLLDQTVERIEGLSVINHLAQTGTVMVFESEHLMERSGMLEPNWPIPPDQIKQEIELTQEEILEQPLEEYLGILYHGSV